MWIRLGPLGMNGGFTSLYAGGENQFGSYIWYRIIVILSSVIIDDADSHLYAASVYTCTCP